MESRKWQHQQLHFIKSILTSGKLRYGLTNAAQKQPSGQIATVRQRYHRCFAITKQRIALYILKEFHKGTNIRSYFQSEENSKFIASIQKKCRDIVA